MQFPVPQFIDTEDKIIGPFTLKQFGFVFAGGLIVVMLFKLFGFGIIFVLVGLPIALLTLFISFGNFNGKKVYNAVPLFIKYLSAPKAMIFQKERNVDNLNIQTITVEQIQAMNAKNSAVAPDVEAPQTQLKRLSRLLDQKNQQEQEIIIEKSKRS